MPNAPLSDTQIDIKRAVFDLFGAGSESEWAEIARQIRDRGRSFAHALSGSDVTNVVAASGSATSLAVELGSHDVTLTADCTFSFDGGESGRSYGLTLVLRQDASGGHAVTWPAAVEWPGGGAPTLTTAANAVDILSFFTNDGGTTWYGFAAGQNFS